MLKPRSTSADFKTLWIHFHHPTYGNILPCLLLLHVHSSYSSPSVYHQFICNMRDRKWRKGNELQSRVTTPRHIRSCRCMWIGRRPLCIAKECEPDKCDQEVNKVSDAIEVSTKRWCEDLQPAE